MALGILNSAASLFGFSITSTAERDGVHESSANTSTVPSSGPPTSPQFHDINTRLDFSSSSVSSSQETGQPQASGRTSLRERIKRVEMDPLQKSRDADRQKEEQRLFPYYGVPPSATPLPDPANSREALSGPPSKPRRPGAGSVRPMNTLSASGPFNAAAKLKHPIGQLPVTRLAGSNVTPKTRLQAARYDSSHTEADRAPKRQKLAHKSQDATVDLTEDCLDGEIIALNGQPLKPAARGLEEPLEAFQQKAFRETQAYIQVPSDKKPRNSTGQRSSQTSQHMSPKAGTPASHHDWQHDPPAEHATDRVAEEDDVEEVAGPPPKRRKPQPQALDMDLTQGFPPMIAAERYGTSMPRGGSSRTQSTMKPMSEPRTRTLAQKMKQQNDQPRAKERMSGVVKDNLRGVGLRVSPIDDSDVVDELHGPKTVGSANQNGASRGKASRQKRQRRLSDDILPGIEGAQQSDAQQEDGDQDYTSIPIMAFHHSRYSADSPADLKLVYYEVEQHIWLFQDGRRVQSRYAIQDYIGLGGNDLQQIMFYADLNFVCLYGSKSVKPPTEKPGFTCIELMDHKDVGWLISIATTLFPNYKTVPAESAQHMEKTFRKKAGDLKTLRDRLDCKERERRSKTNMQPSSNRSSADVIRYELDDTQDRQGKSRSSSKPWLENGRPSEASTGAAISKYFSNKDRGPRRTTRQIKPNPAKTTPPKPSVRWTEANSVRAAQFDTSIVYPPTGIKRVTVDPQDLSRLNEEELLNDNLVNFGLRQIEENLPAEHKDKIHFFNTYFYTALTIKDGRKQFNYAAVKKWTKSRDLFNVPFVVVPINLHFHWFVAIICNLPHLARKIVDLDDGDGDGDDDERSGNGEADVIDVDDAPKTVAAVAQQHRGKEKPEDPFSDVFPFDGDHVTADDRSPTEGRETKGKKKGKSASIRKFDPSAPTIITLDSFGLSRSGEVRVLKDYVTAEANDKRGMVVDDKQLQGVTAKGIPEQHNFSDCGLYLLGYIEQFAKDPKSLVNNILERNEETLQKDFGGFDAPAMRCRMREDIFKLSDDQREAKRKAKAAKAAAKQEAKAPLTAPAASSTPGKTEAAKADDALAPQAAPEPGNTASQEESVPEQGARLIPEPAQSSPPAAGSEAVQDGPRKVAPSVAETEDLEDQEQHDTEKAFGKVLGAGVPQVRQTETISRVQEPLEEERPPQNPRRGDTVPDSQEGEDKVF